MTMLSPSRAEETLHHVVQQFTQWRRSRNTPLGAMFRGIKERILRWRMQSFNARSAILFRF